MKNSLLILLIITSTRLFAQEKIQADTNAVKSIDGIVKEVLRLTSVEKGVPQNLEALKNLFLPTAQFTVLMHEESGSQIETIGLDEFMKMLDDPYYQEGYLEYETGKVVDEYNGIAQVFQSYHGKDSENYEESGVSSYQLVYFNSRWWVASILWTGDSNGVEIPDTYLSK